MLFDLRGRGRRRTVKIVYITLALSSWAAASCCSGSAAAERCRAASSTPSPAAPAATRGADALRPRPSRRPPRPRSATRRTPPPGPRSPAPACRRAGVGDNFDQNTATYTDAGKAEARRRRPTRGRSTSRSTRKKPDDRVAGLMVRAFDQTGLNQPDDAASAQEIITEARPIRDDLRARWRSTPTRRARPARATSPATRPSSRAPADEKNTLKSSARPGQAAGRSPSSSSRARARRRRRRRHAQEEEVAATIGSDRALVAQLAEQRTLNPKVPGSIPGGGTLRNRATARFRR